MPYDFTIDFLKDATRSDEEDCKIQGSTASIYLYSLWNIFRLIFWMDSGFPAFLNHDATIITGGP
jgi:hypothetical protein